MPEMKLVRYDAMCRAIVECYRVDEVKDIRDKAIALEAYAKQAMNRDAEHQAHEIRVRAERKAGELLKQMKKTGERQPQGGNHGNQYKKVAKSPAAILPDLRISADQSSTWQQLAEVPEGEFEAALNDPYDMPSAETIVARHKDKQIPPEIYPKVKVSNDALFVHGSIVDFQRHKCTDLDPQDLYDNMLDTMQIEVDHILPKLIPWLSQLSRRRQT